MDRISEAKYILAGNRDLLARLYQQLDAQTEKLETLRRENAELRKQIAKMVRDWPV